MSLIADLIKTGLDADKVERVHEMIVDMNAGAPLLPFLHEVTAWKIEREQWGPIFISLAEIQDGRGRRQQAPREYRNTYVAPPHRLEPRDMTARLPDKEWWPLRGHILRRDGEMCIYCKDTIGPFCVDHVVPLSRRGGTNEEDNLVVACIPCNSSKNDWLLSEWRGRYQ